MPLSRKYENITQESQNYFKRQEVSAVDVKVAVPKRIPVHATQLLPDGIYGVFFSFFLY